MKLYGTDYSEHIGPMTTKDMADVCKVWHDTYYEVGHMNYEFRKENRNMWKSEKDRLWRFWNKYKDTKEGE